MEVKLVADGIELLGTAIKNLTVIKVLKNKF